MEQYLRIGIISSPHGVKGEVSVYPTTDDINRFTYLQDCFMNIKGEMKPAVVTGCKFKKNMPVLKFEGIDSRDDIEAFRGVELYVDREHTAELEEGEYFLSDVIGFDVYSENEKIGVIEDYIENDADQIIFIVRLNDGSEMMVLDLPEFVLDVDFDDNKMIINVIKGM